MKEKLARVQSDLNLFLSKQPLNQIISLEETEKVILYIVNTVVEIKNLILDEDFSSIEEEITFFKHYKPQIVSHLIIHNVLYRTETEKPSFCSKSEYKYYKRELKKIKLFFEENNQFYQYYKSNQDYLDSKYFVRNRHSIKMLLQTYHIDFNHQFSTSHDYKLAEVIAFEKLQDHFRKKLKKMHLFRPQKPPFFLQKYTLKWTDKKSYLIEVLYGLYETKSINSGKVKLSELADVFSKVFDIQLYDYATVFKEIKKRQSHPTKYIDKVGVNLRLRIFKKKSGYQQKKSIY